MTSTRPILLMLLPLACLLGPGPARAQSASTCPALPAASGFEWQKREGPGFIFCKAVRADGSEAFAVTVSASSPFKPRRGDRAEDSAIDGRNVTWYRGEIASAPEELVRETLVPLPGGNVAHISLRAGSEQALQGIYRQLQDLRFEQTRLSSN